MGLSPRHLKEFQGKRFYSSVLLENIPQLISQIYFLYLLGEFDESTFVALLSSTISVILSVVDIWSAKQLVSVMNKVEKKGNDIATIEFMIDTKNQSFDEIEETKKIFLGKPNALSKAIAETLIVHERNVEIFQLMSSADGIKIGFTVFSIDHHAETMIGDLQNEIKKLQLLISIYWEMKTYPNVTKIKEGHKVDTTVLNDTPWNKTDDVYGEAPA
eukprot:53422_1